MEMSEKKLKGILDEYKKDTDLKIEEYKRDTNFKIDEYKKDTDLKIEKYKKDTDLKIEEYKKDTNFKIEELKRYFDITREDFDSKVKLITEQYGSIMEKLNSHEARLVSIEKNIEIMKVDISFIKNSLKKKVDIEEFEALEKRVAILEAKIR